MKTHTGSCHCKKVTYEADLDLTQPSLECNCSHCAGKGLLLQFIKPEAFTLKTGEGSLKEYRFNTQKIGHQFCEDCGMQPFSYGQDAQGNSLVAVNVRSVDDANVEQLPKKQVDGKSF
jgi:hypothetical protein